MAKTKGSFEALGLGEEDIGVELEEAMGLIHVSYLVVRYGGGKQQRHALWRGGGRGRG